MVEAVAWIRSEVDDPVNVFAIVFIKDLLGLLNLQELNEHCTGIECNVDIISILVTKHLNQLFDHHFLLFLKPGTHKLLLITQLWLL